MKFLRNIITAIILMSSIICANDVRNLDYEDEENPFVVCFLQKYDCEFEFELDKDEEKYLFKMNTIEMLKNGSLNVLVNPSSSIITPELFKASITLSNVI